MKLCIVAISIFVLTGGAFASGTSISVGEKNLDCDQPCLGCLHKKEECIGTKSEDNDRNPKDVVIKNDKPPTHMKPSSVTEQ